MCVFWGDMWAGLSVRVCLCVVVCVDACVLRKSSIFLCCILLCLRAVMTKLEMTQPRAKLATKRAASAGINACLRAQSLQLQLQQAHSLQLQQAHSLQLQLHKGDADYSHAFCYIFAFFRSSSMASPFRVSRSPTCHCHRRSTAKFSHNIKDR